MTAALIERLRGELGEAKRENAKFLHTLERSAIQIDGLDGRVDALQAYARRAVGLLTTARCHLESAADIIADDGGDEEDDAEEREFIGRIDAFLAAPPPAESTPVQPVVSNALDRCVACGIPRRALAEHDDLARDHAFVEAPQPAPSGAEAKMREIALRWKPSSPADCSVAIKCAVREAYAAGKAAGARGERAECELTVRDSCICQGAECACSARLRDIARAIARRGSEGT